MDESFAAALADCQGFLRLIVRRFALERSNIDDLAQEANLRAWRNRASFRPGSDMRAWLAIVARSAAIDYGRSLRGRQRAHESLDRVEVHAPERPPDTLTAEKLGQMILAGDVLDDRQRRWFLARSPRSREMILCAAIGGTYAELAAHFGMPEGTFKSQFHRDCRRAPRP